MPITRRILGRQAATSLYGRTRHDEITYDTPGMTLEAGPVPEGFREHTASRVVGSGDDVFRRVGYSLMHWGLQSGAGFDLKSQHAAVAQGSHVAVAVPVLWPLAVVGACQVVDVVATGRTVGFAYGTLPGHPENGEELFLVTHRDDDAVEVTVRAISAPAAWWAKLGGPIGRGVQKRATKKYLDAAEQVAKQPSTDVALPA